MEFKHDFKKPSYHNSSNIFIRYCTRTKIFEVFDIFIYFLPLLQILVDGNDEKSVDVEGSLLPRVIYIAREKRPQHHHHFKAGSMNALVIFLFFYFKIFLI